MSLDITPFDEGDGDVLTRAEAAQTRHYRVTTNNNPYGGGFRHWCGGCGERWPCRAEQEHRQEKKEQKRVEAHRDLMRREEERHGA